MIVSDSEKRWLVIGIAMNKVVAPVSRDVIKQGMDTHYTNLDTHCSSLTPPCTLATLTYHQFHADPNLRRLKFQNINNNLIIHRNPTSSYNYNVNSSVDLAKLYLHYKHLAEFSAFDGSLDMTAILHLLQFNNYHPSAIFSPAIQTSADAVRKDVRNKWGHFDETEWTEAFFNDCFSKLETLVRSLGLPGDKEKNTLDQLSDWQGKGCQLCMGHAVDKDLLSLIQTEVNGMIKDLALQSAQLFQVQETAAALQVRLDDDEAVRKKEMKLIRESLTAIEKILGEELLGRVQGMEENVEQIEQRATKTDQKVDQLEQRATKTDQKVDQLEQRATKTDQKVDQLEQRATKTDHKVNQLGQGLSDRMNQLELKVESEKPEAVSEVNSFDLKTCQRKLAEHYQRTGKIPTTAWSSICKVNLDEIYTRLSWVKREETATGSSPKEMGHYTEMFAEKSGSGAPPKKRILVQGDTGIGKTTLVKKMLVDWSNLDKTKLDEEQKNVLRRFDLVLAVDLKEVSHCQTFTDVLRNSRLFSRDNDKFFDDLNSYVQKNQERVLLVFDGYDEYRTGSKAKEQYGNRSDSPVFQIFHRTILRDCTVLVTTRSSRADELRGSADIQAEFTGFNKLDRKVFMTKMLKSEREAEQLLGFLKSKGMADLVRVPLLNLFSCLLWREEKNELGKGTKNRTKLYQAIVRFILQHSHRKHSPTLGSKVKEENYEDILAEIGKVALEGLLKGDLLFDYDKLSKALRGEKSVSTGLLQLFEYGPSVEPKGMVSFIHKSIQEYLAAWYVTNKCVPKGNLGGMEEYARTSEKCEELENVFHFICGLSDDGAINILKHLKSVRISNPGLDYSKAIPEKETYESLPDITYEQEKFNGLVYRCFEEVQSKAKLLDLCLDCFGRVVPMDYDLRELLEESEVDNISRLIHSEVTFQISLTYNPFDEKYVEEGRVTLLLEDFGCKDVVVKITETAGPITLRDFFVEYCKEGCACCSFNSFLSLNNGRFQFYVTELTLNCEHHTKLFTGTKASCPQSRSEDRSAEKSCLQFLKVLKCICKGGESFQMIDRFCALLQSVPNPSKCVLNVGYSVTDYEEYHCKEYRVTTAEAEKLAQALRPFTRIESVALDVRKCSAAAVETLVTIITRKTVEELILHGITLTPAAAAALSLSLPEMSSLKELLLTEMDVSNLQKDKVSALLNVFLKMTSFLRFHCFTLKGWPAPLSAISNDVLSLNLRINGINTDERDLVGFLEGLRFTPRWNHLVCVSLTCTGCSEQGNIIIDSSLACKKLKLAGINLSPAVAAALGRSLSDMSSLKFLELTGEYKNVVNIDAEVIKALFGGFETASALQRLEFSFFNVKGCLASLTKSLRFFPGLTELLLSRLNLDGHDLNNLLGSFQFIPLLQSLDLSRNPVGVALRSIVPYVIDLSKLGRLWIKETSSDEDLNYVKEAIRQARPDIDVDI